MRWVLLSSILLPLASWAAETTEVTETAPSDQGRVEVGLVPLAGQLNGQLNTQTSAGLLAAWHLREGFALNARYTQRLWSGFTQRGELLRMDPREYLKPADPWHAWSLMAGTELAPARGSGILWSLPVGVSLVLGGQLGIVSARHAVLGSESMFTPEAGLDAGLQLAAGWSVGARLRLGQHVALRAELTSVLSSSGGATVAGCTEAELEAIQSAGPDKPQVSSRCDLGALDDGRHAGLALNVVRGGVREPLIHTLSAQVGAAFVF